MHDTDKSAKEQRLSQLAQMLSTTGGYTAEELAATFQVAPKTIYQDLKTLRDLGYETDKRGRNRIFLINASARSLIHITPEESGFLEEVLATHTHPLAASIRGRLWAHQTIMPVHHASNEIRKAEIIHRLNKALNSGKRAQIIAYRSASSNSIQNRKVDPLDFLPDYSALRAREVSTDEIKVFKISRMGGVEILDELCGDRPELLPADDFGMFGPDRFEVALKLKSRAAYLMEEEFPLLAQRIQETKDPVFPYQVRFTVCKEEGVGRFVLGLRDHVKVVEGDRLLAYLREKIADFTGLS